MDVVFVHQRREIEILDKSLWTYSCRYLICPIGLRRHMWISGHHDAMYLQSQIAMFTLFDKHFKIW